MIIGGLAFVAMICGAGVLGLMYVGLTSPETKVYTAKEIPNSYLETAKELGTLEDGEEVQYFYSDGLMGIEEGFYFVSDRKVVIYYDDGDGDPCCEVYFGEIEKVTLERDESVLLDSEITLELKDGDYVTFPVSSELDRDVTFAEEIKKRIKQD